MTTFRNIICVTPFFLLGALGLAAVFTQGQRGESVANAVVPTEFVLTGPMQKQDGYTDKLDSRGVYESYWVAAATPDWLLLNGPRGTALCPALNIFGEANAPVESFKLSEVRTLAEGYVDMPLDLQVKVPRFKTAPAGLADCTGFSYDATTSERRVGGKRLAYLMRSQS